MKYIKITTLALIFSSTTLASPVLRIESGGRAKQLVPEWVWSCYQVAAKKMQSQAESFGVRVVPGTFRAIDYDGNVLAKYIWWRAETVNPTTGEKKFITKMTQKPRGGNCF